MTAAYVNMAGHLRKRPPLIRHSTSTWKNTTNRQHKKDIRKLQTLLILERLEETITLRALVRGTAIAGSTLLCTQQTSPVGQWHSPRNHSEVVEMFRARIVCSGATSRKVPRW